MPEPSDEQKRVQLERAKRLMEFIENPEAPPKPKSPHEFVEEKMKELDRQPPKQKPKASK